MPNTVHLHRVLATNPEKVYRAFLEADALAKWLPPNGFVCTVHHLEPTVGGTFRMSFRNFTTGESHAFGGEYVELVAGERLRYTDKFDDPNLVGDMQVTVTLKKVSVGTEVDIVQAGVPQSQFSAHRLAGRPAGRFVCGYAACALVLDRAGVRHHTSPHGEVSRVATGPDLRGAR